MSYCPACCTPRECDERGCARRECTTPPDLFGQCETHYTVEGKGVFPIDMLRVDRSWPATKGAAATIARTHDTPDEKRHRVDLRSLAAPNFRAWLAASWTVNQINGVNL